MTELSAPNTLLVIELEKMSLKCLDTRSELDGTTLEVVLLQY